MIQTAEQTIAWLRHFGYLDTDTPTAAQHDAAVATMQKVYGLEEDGVAGPITRRAMGLFRCAVADHSLAGPAAMRVNKHDCRWQKKTITYAISGKFTLGGNREKAMQVIRSGFAHYAPLTGLKFVETRNYNAADIQIDRGRGKSFQFDGPGNVLAWAYMPCEKSDKQLLAMFDDAEPWNLRTTGPGVIMTAVWMHELGHLLGLDHSASDSDLMAPYYNPQIMYPQPGDIARLSRIYGTVPKADTVVPEAMPAGKLTGLAAGSYSVSGLLQVQTDGRVHLDLDTQT